MVMVYNGVAGAGTLLAGGVESGTVRAGVGSDCSGGWWSRTSIVTFGVHGNVILLLLHFVSPRVSPLLFHGPPWTFCMPPLRDRTDDNICRILVHPLV